MTTHYLMETLFCCSSPWLRTTPLHYTIPLHCKHSFVPTVKLLARISGFLLWSSQSLKRPHYVHLKSHSPLFLLFSSINRFFFILKQKIKNTNQQKVSRRSNRQIWKQKILSKTDVLTQILFTWSSRDKVVFLWERIVRTSGSEKRRGWQY